MIKILAELAILAAMLTGGGQGLPPNAEIVGGYVQEEFIIVEVDSDGLAHGEPIIGPGEGIVLAEDLQVGDRVRVSWTLADYKAENWECMKEVEIVE